MKKRETEEHPKFYKSTLRISENKYKVNYYHNEFTASGNRKLITSIIHNPELEDFENESRLFMLNSINLGMLNRMITRQEKVLETYQQKHKHQQAKTIEDSISGLKAFKFIFQRFQKQHQLQENHSIEGCGDVEL